MKKGNFLAATLPAIIIAAGFLCSEKVFAQGGFEGGGPEHPNMRGDRMQGEQEQGGPGMKERQGGKNGQMAPGASSEAKTACSGKSEKDNCSFSAKKSGSDEETTLEGICIKIPSRNNEEDSDVLSCVPEKKDGENLGENQLERAKKMKERKSEEISRIKSRTEKIISFLESKGVSDGTIDDIEGYLEIFEDKADDLISKINAYITLLENDGSDDDKKEAGENIKTSGKAMMDYFNDTLRKSIKEALNGLSD